ncbi:flavin monoamine oxidase family protein [Thermocoleostomius sinensis]|uniref:NAD(P)/FAD-dependent oxidoreductase n=1 Tax=Thermocoleostomius sinensis A174 TaxID=2016057 RepID=A0A9E8ZGQ9_9CYAN|nr:NAD(P)/FAD-dependent oxidoreductase [Thermocoleostomius sinensis]WAL61529.1 NAD(P)/FAD-dependent oxidoreductase [Thermocoleostomius sinensis A174]
MSRTSLIDLLRRTYQIFQISRATKIPTSDIPGLLNEKRSLGMSRRQVLQGLAIAGVSRVAPFGSIGSFSKRTVQAGGASLQRPLLDTTSIDTTSKVLVVGAGIAGLTVAYRLHQAGVPVEVIEASPRIGGRLRSAKASGSQSVVELGGEFIDSHHHAVHALAAELGLEMGDLRAADQGLEPEILYFQGQRISHQWVADEFAPLARQIAQDVGTLSRWSLTYHDPHPDALRLDRLSLAEYLAATPMHPVIEQLIRVAYITEYGLDAESQSCLNLLFLIGAEAGQWSTYGISDERYHVIGGNDQIPRQLADRLHGRIETGTALESISRTATGRYRVSVRSGATSTDRCYDQVVLTVPFTVLRQINLDLELPPVKQAAIAELGYGTSTKLAIPFQERLWRTRYNSTISIYTDRTFQNTWESARYMTGPDGWLTDLRGGTAGVQLASGNPQTHAQTLVEDLNVLFPGLTEVKRGQAMRAAWMTEPHALGSYSCYLPGQWSRFGGAEIERVDHLWFAGEHCSIGSQGYMNGACETAEQVAQGILQHLGAVML